MKAQRYKKYDKFKELNTMLKGDDKNRQKL